MDKRKEFVPFAEYNPDSRERILNVYVREKDYDTSDDVIHDMDKELYPGMVIVDFNRDGCVADIQVLDADRLLEAPSAPLKVDKMSFITEEFDGILDTYVLQETTENKEAARFVVIATDDPRVFLLKRYTRRKIAGFGLKQPKCA